MGSISSKAAICLLCCTLPNAPVCANATGQIDVRLQILPGCEISSGRDPAASATLGMLDFGAASPVWNDALQARLSGTRDSGALEVICSPDVNSFNVAIDGGLRGNRTLLRTGGSATNPANLVSYSVFRDAARRDEYPPNAPQAYAVSNNGRPVPVPMFGAITPNFVPKSSGVFTDTLLITIDL